jgi:hypothetical protein
LFILLFIIILSFAFILQEFPLPVLSADVLSGLASGDVSKIWSKMMDECVEHYFQLETSLENVNIKHGTIYDEIGKAFYRAHPRIKMEGTEPYVSFLCRIFLFVLLKNILIIFQDTQSLLFLLVFCYRPCFFEI